MHPPDPFPPSGTGYPSPGRVATDLTATLARHGITGIYTASAEKFAVISVTAALTVWTNGRRSVHPRRPAPHLGRHRHRSSSDSPGRPRPSRRQLLTRRRGCHDQR